MSLCHSVLQKSPVSLRHSVILSSKNICLPLSLCHSVFKKNICLSPSLCHSVFKKNICLSFSLCHYVGRQRIQNLDKTVQKNRKEGVSIMTHPLLLCYYLEEEISSQRPFYFFLPFVMYFIATFISLAITFASRWKSSLSFPCK